MGLGHVCALPPVAGRALADGKEDRDLFDGAEVGADEQTPALGVEGFEPERVEGNLARSPLLFVSARRCRGLCARCGDVSRPGV